MEYIIQYVNETWECPVIIYTGTRFDSEEYQAMVDMLPELQDKWDIGVIDLWNNDEISEVIGTEQYDKYMSDPIHPTKERYVEWWTPYFESYLSEYVTNSGVK